MSAKPGVLVIGNFQSAHIHTRAVYEELAPRLRQRGWEVFTASERAGKLSRLADMLAAVLRYRNRYQVAMVDVHAASAFRWGELVAALLRRVRKPTLLTLRTGSLPELAQRHPERVRRMFGGAAAVVTPSPFLQEAMRPYRSDILQVPHGMELRDYPFRLRNPPEPRLVWLRAFYDAYYNPALAVRVAARLLPEFPQLHLTMIGPDRGDGSLQATRSLARELGVTGHLELLGGISKREVPLRLAQGDLFLNTPRVDNTPMTVLEAMACGLCVVSTDIGGMPYMLRDGVDALLSPDDDADAMALNIKKLLLQPGKAEIISQQARERAALHDWVKVLPIWIGLLHSLAHGENPLVPPSTAA